MTGEPSAEVIEAARQKVQMVPAVQEAYLELRRCCAEFGKEPSARRGDRLDAANDRYVSEILAARAALNAAGAVERTPVSERDCTICGARHFMGPGTDGTVSMAEPPYPDHLPIYELSEPSAEVAHA